MSDRADRLGALFGEPEPEAAPDGPPSSNEPPAGEPAASSTTARDRRSKPTKGKQRSKGPWNWPSGVQVSKSHRYPIELIDELDTRIHELKLPVGLTVAAAVAMLLDLPDDELVAAVRRAHDSRPVQIGR